MPNTIRLKAYTKVVEEYDANAAITPGMLIEVMSTDKVRAHSTANGDALCMFALEDELQGNEIDDAYAADDKVQCWIPNRGDQVYAILRDDDSVSIGDFLCSNGDGALRKHYAGSSAGIEFPLQIVGQALEAVDTTGSSGESSGILSGQSRIKIRIV